eukprot:7461402-Pyramimonas_sp.AAC.1
MHPPGAVLHAGQPSEGGAERRCCGGGAGAEGSPANALPGTHAVAGAKRLVAPTQEYSKIVSRPPAANTATPI